MNHWSTAPEQNHASTSSLGTAQTGLYQTGLYRQGRLVHLRPQWRLICEFVSAFIAARALYPKHIWGWFCHQVANLALGSNPAWYDSVNVPSSCVRGPEIRRSPWPKVIPVLSRTTGEGAAEKIRGRRENDDYPKSDLNPYWNRLLKSPRRRRRHCGFFVCRVFHPEKQRKRINIHTALFSSLLLLIKCDNWILMYSFNIQFNQSSKTTQI